MAESDSYNPPAVSLPGTSAPRSSVTPVHPTFAEAFRFWLKLGFISFGGPAGQIAVMHTELVEKKRWIGESRFLHALNYCMLLPGPEAQQLAIYIGWLLHRTWGGVVAGALFVLPSAFILWGLGFVYVTWGNVAWVAAVFAGLKPAVLAIVVGAVFRIGRKALKNEVMWGIAVVAFVAIFFFKVPFPAIVLGAGLLGLAGQKWWREKFVVLKGHAAGGPHSSVLDDDTAVPNHARPSWKRSFNVAAVFLILWWGPVAAIGAWLGRDHVLFQQGIFFSKASMVTFGGAYAVLPYVSQEAVGHFGWLSAGQMMDGLGLAETTPGPLVMVLQFVGFVGGWKFHEPFSPFLTATLGAAITTWTTFLPCFLWILLGAHHIERLRGNVRMTAVLSAITASVVGVVMNLALWFGLHALVPAGQPVNWFGFVVSLVAFIGMTRWRWGIIPVAVGAGVLGLIGKQLLGL
jgi:chromate transporter